MKGACVVDEVMMRSTCKFKAFLLTSFGSASCSRVRVFELAVLLSSLRDSCRSGVGKKGDRKKKKKEKNCLDEKLERGTIIVSGTKWPRIATRVFRLSAKKKNKSAYKNSWIVIRLKRIIDKSRCACDTILRNCRSREKRDTISRVVKIWSFVTCNHWRNRVGYEPRIVLSRVLDQKRGRFYIDEQRNDNGTINVAVSWDKIVSLEMGI